MKLGLVTYNLAPGWDLETLISRCGETGFQGVELRTTHAHGVEVALSRAERERVKRRFEDSPVELAGLGSAFEYHSSDPETLRANIEGTKEYAVLARDVGAPGIKVRPNGLVQGRSAEESFRQIGAALAECAEFCGGIGVELRLEVHGYDTQHPANIAEILRCADHDGVKVCWNCNPADLEGAGFETHFDRLFPHFGGILHFNELWKPYPWRRLFEKLAERDYRGFLMAEIPSSEDPVTVMHYYRLVFEAYRELALRGQRG